MNQLSLPSTALDQDVGRLGRLAYERDIRPKLSPEDHGKFVAIDVDTSDFVADEDDYTANMRLLERNPQARIWLTRAGFGAAYRIRICAERFR